MRADWRRRGAPRTSGGEPAVARLLTSDGVALTAHHHPGPAPLGVVLAHGFTGSALRPAVRRAATALTSRCGVVSVDFRGHGRSGGRSTVGDREVLDLAAAVAWSRELGYRAVATLGFSMGAAVALRHAASIGGVEAVVAVSGPSRWYYRDTAAMRRVHWAIETRLGRSAVRLLRGTRIVSTGWDAVPEPPDAAAARIAPTPLLIVHGDADPLFPVDHAHALHRAAGGDTELWIEPGFGHAEEAATPELVGRIGDWLTSRATGVRQPAVPGAGER